MQEWDDGFGARIRRTRLRGRLDVVVAGRMHPVTERVVVHVESNDSAIVFDQGVLRQAGFGVDGVMHVSERLVVTDTGLRIRKLLVVTGDSVRIAECERVWASVAPRWLLQHVDSVPDGAPRQALRTAALLSVVEEALLWKRDVFTLYDEQDESGPPTTWRRLGREAEGRFQQRLLTLLPPRVEGMETPWILAFERVVVEELWLGRDFVGEHPYTGDTLHEIRARARCRAVLAGREVVLVLEWTHLPTMECLPQTPQQELIAVEDLVGVERGWLCETVPDVTGDHIDGLPLGGPGQALLEPDFAWTRLLEL